MGLNCSHDAFDGAYSAFNRLRQVICKVAGGSFPPHDDPSLDSEQIYLPQNCRECTPGLFAFLIHSDCDGEIDPEMCVDVANDLEALLPQIEALANESWGHIKHNGGYAAVTRRFIEGCRRAAAANEPLVFM